ncbi:maleylpyruvate isomerase family mycothiol-dependent enzyme [Streptomyces qinzhouensis]|uniref:Maleylpyruvate isomerase family mycothiol-dependent enzyme n=1 Tax=Streptomyces qinzhouensis TaxID=2599401 RepID=A0A5B8J618_9ACTN|nr:maleylpyruvate isomerase family mycothiol-dependent enzyme [Streptomyces qinzhouensis]QDY75481.1 maleylpyruvate isomerase family mycothiol-dependent enzyme [Streptomyces qinzhouensis]
METQEFIGVLDREGGLLADAAEAAGPDAAVPTCPDWQVRDLVRHTGTVHRWVTSMVAGGHTEPRSPDPLPDLDGDPLTAWFREGHRKLVEVLDAAPADLRCWSFMPAPSPLAFWARRQAHETAVHRVDAESALGGAPVTPGVLAPLAPDFAADGIAELLTGFHAGDRSRVRSDPPRTLRVRTVDTGQVWTVRISTDPPVTDASATGPADCELSGTADQLYLALWNRLPLSGVSLRGDASSAALWRELSAV